MFHRGWFAVWGQGPGLDARSLGVLQRYGVTYRLSEGRGPERLAEEPQRWVGAVVAAAAPAIPARVEAVRAVAPLLPVLAVPDRVGGNLVNWLQARGVEVARAPLAEPNLVGFAQRALVAGFLPDERVARLVSQLAHARQLTPREVQLLSFALGGEPRPRMRRRLGITENTFKCHVRQLLRKCGERSLDGLAKNVLRAALLAERPAPGAQREPVAPWAA